MTPLETALAVVRSISDPIFLIDDRGLLAGANAAAVSLSGLPESALNGQSARDLLGGDPFDELLGRWRRSSEPAPGIMTLRVEGSLRSIPCEGSKLELDAPHSHTLVLVRCREQASAMPRFQALEEQIQALAREVGERQRTEQALRESERRFRALFEHASDAILIADDEARIVEANPAACELIGRPAGEITQMRVTSLADPGMSAEASAFWERFLKSGVQRGLFPIQRPDREMRIAEYSAVRDFVEGRHLSILRDVTDRQRAEEQRERQAQALARSNAELEQFAYIASHDLQEPLRTIASFVELTRRRLGSALDEDSAEYMTLVRNAVHRLKGIILDLLEFSSLANSEPVFSPVKLDDVLANVLRELLPYIEASNANISVHPLPAVEGDRIQLTTLFQNLIENALKFHPGVPEIVVAADRRDSEWVISVRDNGPGIEPQYFVRIFEPFRRLHGQEIPGSGIGLAISKRIAEKHEGRIWVESEPGAGATFLVALRAA